MRVRKRFSTGVEAKARVRTVRIGNPQDLLVKGANVFTHEIVIVTGRGTAPASLQSDERVARNLVSEPHTALTQHAAFPVNQNLASKLYRFWPQPLFITKAGMQSAMRHGLILQWAFPALIANRAIQGVVNQQEFGNPVLSFLRYFRSRGSFYLHPGHRGHRAGWLRLGHGTNYPITSRHRHLYQALPAGSCRV